MTELASEEPGEKFELAMFKRAKAILKV